MAEETEGAVMSVQEMCDDPQVAAQELFTDPSIFEALTLREKKRVYGSVKRISPQPEFKKDFVWLKAFMQEAMQEPPDPNTPEEVTSAPLNTDERTSIIIKLRNDGLTLKQIGEQIGLSGPRVSGILRALDKEAK